VTRPLTAAAVQSAFAQSTDKAWLILVELESTDGAAFPFHKYYVNDWQNIESGGQTYEWWPFRVTLLSDVPGEIPDLRLQIDNVHQDLISILRRQDRPVMATISVILHDSPNDIQWGPQELEIQTVPYDVGFIEAVLSVEPIHQEGFPGYAMSPMYLPAIFGPVPVEEPRAPGPPGPAPAPRRGGGAPIYVQPFAPKGGVPG